MEAPWLTRGGALVASWRIDKDNMLKGAVAVDELSQLRQPVWRGHKYPNIAIGKDIGDLLRSQ
jgi:hypothetical protein